jgi:predicted peptidase
MRLCLISELFFLPLAFVSLVPALAQPPAPGRFQRPPDPRAQQRTYHFADTNEDLPYAIYVSSKVSKDKKNPLIIALHGLGGNQNSLVRGNAIDLAEEGGYILVGPMGYNPRGWYGSPLLKPPPGATPRPPNPEAANDPPNLRELSEKDVMNVLDIVRKEFNVDERRTYLMGHSMGGAGTLYLGSKYASDWAAIAAIAPAAFAMLPNAEELLKPIKKKMPVLIAQGDADKAVPVDYTRRWIGVMKNLGMNYEYIELPGEDHGTIIAKSMPTTFAFFNQHTR